mmetsp:Transcript_1484/g.2057  ORF Transcript_1484/g.2057 Transcript_1484/m.2057 type:complete len:202 (+) Transcript_1484:319-924(+)
MPVALVLARSTKSHALHYAHLVPHYRCLPNDDRGAGRHIQAAPYTCGWVDVCAENLGVHTLQVPGQGHPAPLVQPVGEPVRRHRMKPLAEEEGGEYVGGAWVPHGGRQQIRGHHPVDGRTRLRKHGVHELLHLSGLQVGVLQLGGQVVGQGRLEGAVAQDGLVQHRRRTGVVLCDELGLEGEQPPQGLAVLLQLVHQLRDG